MILSFPQKPCDCLPSAVTCVRLEYFAGQRLSDQLVLQKAYGFFRTVYRCDHSLPPRKHDLAARVGIWKRQQHSSKEYKSGRKAEAHQCLAVPVCDLLTAAEPERTRVAVHGEVHQTHWTVCSDGQSKRGRTHTRYLKKKTPHIYHGRLNRARKVTSWCRGQSRSS